MGFYAILNLVNRLLNARCWKLQRCRRQGDGLLRYFVADGSGHVVTPTTLHHRRGLTLKELLRWLEACDDVALATDVRAIHRQPERA